MSRAGRIALCLPALALFALFVLIPALGTLAQSGFHVGADGQPRWVGGLYYRYALGDARLHRALGNNLVYFLWTLLFEVGLGLALALALERPTRLHGALRVAFFAPISLSLVVVGLLSGFLFQDGVGLFPGALSPDWARLTVSLVSGWAYCGFYMVVFLAGLAAIPRDLEEAARLDGASEWQVIRHVKLPLLSRSFAAAVVLCFAGAFRAFDLFWVMLPNQEHTEIVATLLVRELLQLDDPGYGSTLAVLLCAFVLGGLGLGALARRALTRGERGGDAHA